MLGGIQFGSGLVSGIDFRSIVDAIIEAESFPIRRLESRIDTFTRAKQSVSDLQALLGDFESSLRDLKSSAAIGGKTATFATEQTAVGASAGPEASTGTFTIDVSQIAQAHRVRSDGLADRFSPFVADGTITIQSGSNDPITIDVSSANGNNSLQAVSDAINNADSGVRASIVNDGTNDILVVRSEKTGTNSALTISDSTNLNLDVGTNELQGAQDSVATVDGIQVTSQSNTLSTAIQGVTLTLSGTTATPVELTISEDVEGAKQALTDFVDGYNAIADFFDAQFGSATSQLASPIAGSSIIRNLQSRLQGLVVGSVTGVPDGSISSLSQLGVQVADRTGRLEFKASTFDDIVEQGRFDEVRSVLQSSGSTTDPAVVYLGASSRTEAGAYDVQITSVAAAAQITAGAAVGMGGINKDETLTITLNGDSTDVALLKNDDAQAIVDKINAALSAAGIEATASQTSSVISIVSNDVGSTESLTVVSDQNAVGNGKSSEIGTTPLSADGTDLTGTIGGFAADAVGNELIGADGTPVDGLHVRVFATAESIAAKGGDFGQVGFSQGVVDLFLEQIDAINDPFEGTIKSIQDGFDSTIESLRDRIERVEARLLTREELLVRQFSAAEQAISGLQQMLASIQGAA